MKSFNGNSLMDREDEQVFSIHKLINACDRFPECSSNLGLTGRHQTLSHNVLDEDEPIIPFDLPSFIRIDGLPYGSAITSNIIHQALPLEKTELSEETSYYKEIRQSTIKMFESQSEGKLIKSKTFHQPLSDNYESLEFNLKSAFLEIEKTYSEVPKKLRDTTGIIAKSKAGLAFSDLTKDLTKMLKFMVLGRQLYLWLGFVWTSLDVDSFTLHVRERLQGDPLLAKLSTKSFDELYKKLLTDPVLQVSEYDIVRQPNLIACYDGVIDVLTNERKPSDPKFNHFAVSNISSFDRGCCQGTYFEIFIHNCTNGDRRLRTRILQLIGVVLSGYNLKCIFLLLGPKNTGKSQLMDLLKILVGSTYCESFRSLNDFSDYWATGKLVGKKLCVCPDIPKEIIKTPAMAVMRQLVGGDLVAGNKKYKDPFSFVNEATIVVSSNHPIQIEDPDDNDAFIDRIITVPFYNTVSKDKMIDHLGEKMAKEIGYILREVSTAMNELLENNFVFSDIELLPPVMDAYTYSNTMNEFCEKRCCLVPNVEIPTTELYDAYVSFCKDCRKDWDSKEVFARTLHKQYPDLGYTRSANGKNLRGFVGITLNSKHGEDTCDG